MAGTPLLPSCEVRFAEPAGKARVALRIPGEHDEMGPWRVGDAGPGWRRAGQRDLRAEDGAHPELPGSLEETHHPVQPVMIGQGKCFELEPGRLGDKLVRV